MHTPAPQYADVTTAFIIQHVKAAAGAVAAGDAAASSAGLSARPSAGARNSSGQSGVAGSTTRARKATPLAAIARTESFGAGMRPKALHADWP